MNYEDRRFYHYRPRPVGGDIVVSLDDEAIYLATNTKSIKMAFDTIASVRTVFRPASLFLKKYIVTLQDKKGMKVSFSNVTFRGLAEQIDKNAEFDPFVHELLTKLKPYKVESFSGEPAWRFYPICFLSLALVLMGINVVYNANSLWLKPVLAVIVAYIAYTSWQWFTNNKPKKMLAIPPKTL
jgi:hypothetical protein